MKNILFFAFCAVVFIILIEAQEKYARRQRFNLDHIELPRYVHSIPGGRHNYRSPQLTLEQLDSILAAGLITTVIRLNGDGRDAAGVSVKKERALCDAHSVGFILLNAHAPDAALTIHGLLLDGRTLIHCRHGFDRTGAMVGYHLRRLGYTRAQVIRHNGWNGYIEPKGPKYRKYMSFIQ